MTEAVTQQARQRTSKISQFLRDTALSPYFSPIEFAVSARHEVRSCGFPPQAPRNAAIAVKSVGLQANNDKKYKISDCTSKDTAVRYMSYQDIRCIYSNLIIMILKNLLALFVRNTD